MLMSKSPNVGKCLHTYKWKIPFVACKALAPLKNINMKNEGMLSKNKRHNTAVCIAHDDRQGGVNLLQKEQDRKCIIGCNV